MSEQWKETATDVDLADVEYLDGLIESIESVLKNHRAMRRKIIARCLRRGRLTRGAPS